MTDCLHPLGRLPAFIIRITELFRTVKCFILGLRQSPGQFLLRILPHNGSKHILFAVKSAYTLPGWRAESFTSSESFEEVSFCVTGTIPSIVAAELHKPLLNIGIATSSVIHVSLWPIHQAWGCCSTRRKLSKASWVFKKDSVFATRVVSTIIMINVCVAACLSRKNYLCRLVRTWGSSTELT